MRVRFLSDAVSELSLTPDEHEFVVRCVRHSLWYFPAIAMRSRLMLDPCEAFDLLATVDAVEKQARDHGISWAKPPTRLGPLTTWAGPSPAIQISITDEGSVWTVQRPRLGFLDLCMSEATSGNESDVVEYFIGIPQARGQELNKEFADEVIRARAEFHDKHDGSQ